MLGNEGQSDSTHDRCSVAAAPDSHRLFFDEPKLLATALEHAQIGIWSCDIATGRASWSNNIETIHGSHVSSFGQTISALENAIHEEDRKIAMAALRDAMTTRASQCFQYRLAPRPGSQECWIETSATVVGGADAPLTLLCICREVSRELPIRAEQQKAVARLGKCALIESNLQKFCDQTVRTIATVLDVEMVKILELVPNDAEFLLRAGIGWKPAFVGTALVDAGRISQAGFTLATGGPVSTENLLAETRFVGQPLLRDHHVTSGATVPIVGHDGRTYGVLGAHSTSRRRFCESEISFLVAVSNLIAGAIQRHQIEQRQELMIRELRHRSGNLFAQLLALFSQTARNSVSVADLATKYEARVLALANAHRLMIEGGWKTASLTAVLNAILAPHLDRISLSGSDVFVDPDSIVRLSLAVHELATNALQYGSLSSGTGRIELNLTVDHTAFGHILVVDWKERGGPAPKSHPHARLGMRLVTLLVERQLNGHVQQKFEPGGLEARLVMPLSNERWPGAAKNAGTPIDFDV